jgi:hypothetical protein
MSSTRVLPLPLPTLYSLSARTTRTSGIRKSLILALSSAFGGTKLTQPIRRHERNTAVSAGGGVYTSGGGGAVGEGRGGGVEQHWVHLDK